jgi:mannose-6-phosphate isomerase-like protein (cupin superfamily)
MSYLKKNALSGRKVKYKGETIFESGIDKKIGIALASIKESKPHYHKKTTEWYLVIEGSAKVYLDGKEEKLEKYDILKINPKTVHWVQGNVKLWVISFPPWRKEDHHVVMK